MGSQQDNPYDLSKDIIRRDLSEELPQWILSAYGPGRDAPEQLFGGYPREQSFEEIRLRHLEGVLSGNGQAAINDIEGLNQSARQQVRTVLGNLDAAIQFVVDAGNKHPNRKDICQQGTMQGGTTGEFAVGKPRNPAFGGQPTAFGAPANAFQTNTQRSSAFGAPSQPAASGFGQASALGQKPSPFGAPAFGQPTKPAGTTAFGQPTQPTSGFGQPSALGAKPNPFGTPAFGQPTQPAAAPAFGQPSQPSTTPAFGQPSQQGSAPAFGQPSKPAGVSAFGQPSQLNSGFGQPSALGQKPNPFGAPSGPSNASPFATAGSQQPAGQNLFGQASQAQQNASPFGQAATSQPAANPFGKPATSSPFATGSAAATTSPFGQPQPAKTNPFGSAPAANNAATAGPFSSAMDTTSATPAASNPFGAAPTNPPASNPFGKPTPAPFGQQNNTTAPSNAPTGPSAAAGSTNPYPPTAAQQHPPLSSYASKNPDDTLRMFKGRAVVYLPPPGGDSRKPIPMVRGPDGGLAKIWFPNGPPGYTRDTEAADEGVYEKADTLASWKTFAETGRFADGVMPLVPPRREWCTWDF